MFFESDISFGRILSTKYYLNIRQFLRDCAVRIALFSIRKNRRMMEFRFCHFNGSNLTNIDYDLNEATRRPLIMSIITGCTCLLAAYIRVAFSNVSAERQIRTIRKKLFRSILDKDIAFFDQHKTGELTVQLTDNINKICNGIGDRLTGATEMMATFISCFVVGKVSLGDNSTKIVYSIVKGFTRGWKLSLVVLSVTPLIFIPIIVFFKVRFFFLNKK